MKTLILAAGILLAGCSVLPKPEVETRFVLQPVVPVAQVQAPAPTTAPRVLNITRPDVPMDLRGSQLVLIRNGELTYYAGKAWSAAVPDLLNAALARDLSATLPTWIVTGDKGLRKDYELQLEVRQFATTQDANGTAVVIDADVRVVKPLERTVVQVLPFRYREAMPALSTADTLQAYNKGWQMLIGQTVEMLGQLQFK